MKCGRLFGALLVALFIVLMVPAAVSEAASYKAGKYKINTKETGLNVRSCPGSEYMKVGEVPKGKTVTVTLVSGNWGKIIYGSVHGWISLDYCKYQGEADVSPVSKATSGVYGISAENLTWVTGCKQEYSKSSGLCTSCATGTLLRRRQAAEGKAVTFTFGDTRVSCGGNPVPDKKGYYESCSFYYTPANGWIHTDEETGEKEVYYTVKEEEKTHTHNREYIADLLDVHPEGIVVYANYGSKGRHAILISDYVRKKDGSLQFYAYDPANGEGRRRLEDTWMLTKYKSVGGYFSNIRSIWYIKGELEVDDSKFEHPEAQTFCSTMTVAKKKTFVYIEPDTDSEYICKLSKNTSIVVNYIYADEDGKLWYITEDGYYVSCDKLIEAEEGAVAESITKEDSSETASDTDEASANADEAAANSDEAAANTDEVASDANEAASDTNEAASDANEVTANSDETGVTEAATIGSEEV